MKRKKKVRKKESKKERKKASKKERKKERKKVRKKERKKEKRKKEKKKERRKKKEGQSEYEKLQCLLLHTTILSESEVLAYCLSLAIAGEVQEILHLHAKKNQPSWSKASLRVLELCDIYGA